MSKKIGFALVALLVSVSLSGCGKVEEKKLPKDDGTSAKKEVTQKEVTKAAEKMVEGSGLRKLIEKRAKIKCEYKMQAEGEEMESLIYIDGDNFKTVANMNGMEATTVFDGDAYYTWTKGEVTQGSKVTMSCLDKMDMEMAQEGAEEETEEMGFRSVGDIAAGEANMDMNCSEVGTIDLTIPSDIKFIDTCKVMEGMQDMTEEMDIEGMQEKMEQLQKDAGM